MKPLEPESEPGVIERAKLDALKELAYGASHEINNPLANIATRAQMLLKLEEDPEKRRMLASIHAQAMRAHEMIADLMLFARPPELRLCSLDLGVLLHEIMAELLPAAHAQRSQLLLTLPPMPVVLDADATQLGVAVRAVIKNALEAVESEGLVEVTLHADRDAARIRVCDNGPGVPAEVRPHIFEPFYSGREAGRGLGFGLARCWRIITDHGGSIAVLAAVPRGTTLEMCLPKVAEPVRAH